MKILSALDMAKNEIQNFLAHVIAGDAGSPSDGQLWYNSTSDKFRGRANGANVTFVNDGGDLTAGSVANTALATNPLARANHTGSQTASTISDFDTQVRLSRLDQMAVPTSDVNLNSRKITSLLAPTAGTDAANKQYVDDTVAGLSWKDEVQVATAAAGTLASSFANGQTVDGQTLVTGQRILIKDQAAPAENGIYTVNGAGAPTRATDADTAAEITGAAVFVKTGTANAGTRWVCNVSGTIVLGTTGLTFASFGGGSSYTAGNGLTLSTNDFNVGAGTGIVVNANDVAIDTAVVARKFSATIGDGSTTAIAVTHSLGTKDVIASVREVSSDAVVLCDVVHTSTTVSTFMFAVAPTSNQYRVTVLG